jgi:patatin-related protein
MEFEKPSPVTQLTQELRLATTMTGGVSLAIWMAGVAREINLLAQASQWRREHRPLPTDNRLSKESTASLRLYAGLIDLLDMVVDVDTLSGTSAGGINAALLGSSRLSGADLGGLRELWLDLGALSDLIRNPTDKDTPSLLYGDERMFARLAEEIPNLTTGPFPPAKFPGGDRAPSTTLFITTTLLNGETSRFTDAFGTLVQDVDRRGLFTFTETELQEKSTARALALAARSSASFPAAFEPSFVPFMKGTREKGDVPARPAMARYTNITRPHWVADGGLLDNQPLGVLLKRVFDRPARRQVRRVLLFVVPSSGPAPDLAEADPPDDVNKPLGLLDGLLKDLSAITTQSIAADLRAIRTHQDRMEARTNAKLRLAEHAATTLPDGVRLLSTNLLRDYREREATKLAQTLTNAMLRQLSTWPPAESGVRESIAKTWESELKIGGDAEKVCRRQITASILKRWTPSQPDALPVSLAGLALYDQPAYDLAKAAALSVVLAGNALARSEVDVAALSDLTYEIFRAWPPPPSPDQPPPPDLVELVRSVCITEEAQRGSLSNAAGLLAEEYLPRLTVPDFAWDSLGAAVISGYETLQRLATTEISATDAEADSLLKRHEVASSELNMYLAYLRPVQNARAVMIKLFDLAATQRAMLPADADIEQSLELVQLSADTRSLLAPDWQTAQKKLTGMQFHHFGAFYKRSWRANDWMWGRLDGAGWLVHILLDPRRVRWIAQQRAGQRRDGESGVDWFLRKLKEVAALDFPGLGDEVTKEDLRKELRFLDDPLRAIPPSIPKTSLWLAQAWQRRVLDEELDVLAKAVLDPEPGKTPDWSPTRSRTWAQKVLAASPGGAKYVHLNSDAVAKETFATDKGSPLMARTITKAAATASAAVGSIRQLPGVLKPPLMTIRTLTLAGYRLVSLTKGVAWWSILIGAALLVLGVAAATQSASVFGVTGLVLAGTGGYLLVLGTWQISGRLLFALLSVTVVGAVLSLAAPCVRRWLFGTEKVPGLVGSHVYWLGEQWWHPLIVVAGLALAVILIAAARPRRKRDRVLR